ncbi:MAG: propionyl-CoA carboxylase [Dehalococcoidia bacterium]|nr:propionyl-CoA carboxylase [Dehalococcoidia bacterium]
MGWEKAIEEIRRRQELALHMGGPERVQQQHDAGRLTIRERVDLLVDPGSFLEVGGLAGKSTYIDGILEDFKPSGYIIGLAQIDGRDVVIGGEDRTVRGTGGRPKQRFAEKMARHYRVPLIRFLEGAGADIQQVEELGHTYLANSSDWSLPIDLLSEVPVVGACVGPAAGAPAVDAMLSHFLCMVRGQGQLFAAGPPVVKRAIGLDISKEDLGGAAIHVDQSGVAHNDAPTEADCFAQVRRFLSFLPANACELPPYKEPTDSPDRRAEELASIVPESRNRPYDVRKLIAHVVDDGDFFEIQPRYGRSAVVGFARMNGHAVGVLANDPKWIGGAIDGPAADKQTHFIEMCDFFNLPLINFADVPGVMIGPGAEKSGALRRGVRAFWMAYKATVPMVTVVVRKCYGLAGNATSRASGLNLRLAWPSGEWGSLPIEGGVDAAFRREIENAPDPAARRKELEERLLRLRSPFATADAFGVEEIIDPRDTRRLIIRHLEVAIRNMPRPAGPKSYPGVRP